MRSLWSGLLAALSLLLLAPAASAQTPVRLVYRAPPGCPAPGDFASAVSSRGASWRDAAPHEDATLIEVSLRQREGSGFSGALRMREPGASPGQREVQGETCAEVADAIASILALALRDAPTPVSPAASSAAPAASSAAPPPPPAPEAPAPARPEPPPDDEPDPRIRTSGDANNKVLRVRAGDVRISRQFSLTLLSGLASGYQPSAGTPRYDLTFERANFVTTPDREGYLVGPIVRLRVGLVGEATVPSPVATMRLNGGSYGMGICYSPTYDTHGLVLQLCSEMALNLIHTDIKFTSDGSSTSHNLKIGTLGLSLAGRYHFGSRFHVAFALNGDSRFGNLAIPGPNGTTLHSLSGVSFSGQIGLGVHFL